MGMPGMRAGPGGGRRRGGRFLSRERSSDSSATSGPVGGGDLGICDEIIRQSDERWSDYFSPVDPTSAGQSVVDEPASVDDSGIA